MSSEQNHHSENSKTLSVQSNPASDEHTRDSDEIIDLTDVVQEGKDPSELDADAPILLDEEDSEFQERPGKTTEDDADTGFSPAASVKTDYDEDSFGETDGESFEENDFSDMTSPDFKFDNRPVFEDTETRRFSDQSQKHIDHVLAGLEKEVTEFERPEDILNDIESGEFEDDLATDEAGVDWTIGHDMPPISEEKIREFVLEAVQETTNTVVRETVESTIRDALAEVTRGVIQKTVDEAVRETLLEAVEKAVHETVTPVVRESVSEIAEKVIQEAIEALKESIGSSEQS